MNLASLKLRPRHKWFSATDREAEEWTGPCSSFERAIFEQARDVGHYPGKPIYVTQGRKLSSAQRVEMGELGLTHEWEVAPEEAIEVRL